VAKGEPARSVYRNSASGFAQISGARSHTLTTSFLWKFQTFGVIWLGTFLFSMSNIVISTGLFDVAWFHVVNVTLSFTLFVAIAIVALCLALAVLNIAMGRPGQALVFVLCAGLYTLLPFASILAYDAFGALGGAISGGTSFIYADFASLLARFLSWFPQSDGSGAPDNWLRWASAASALLGLVLNSYAARRRARQAM